VKYYSKGVSIKIRTVITALVTLFLLFLLTNSLGFNELSFELISSNREKIDAFIAVNYLLSIFIYSLIYILLLSIGMPFGALMSVMAGFFFGLYAGVIMVVLNATLSSVLTYLVGKKLIYSYLKKRHSRRVDAVENEVKKNGAYYVLAVRFSSILPFFWVNLLFGASGIGFKSYIIPTFIGLIPGTIVYTNIGSSLSSLESFRGFFSVEIALSFLLLGILAILPVAYRRSKQKEKNVV
jgi:uncharacterized membrane protein YdjX (TVP38/TMEM64 family)